MPFPSIKIDLPKIRENAERLNGLCDSAGIKLMGVSKGVLGSPEVVSAFIDAGLTTIGDSRIENIKKIRDRFPELNIVFLRNPMVGEIKSVVDYADISFNTEIETIKKINGLSGRLGKIHGVIVTIEMGDLREGVTTERLPRLINAIGKMKNVRIDGFAANFSCVSGEEATGDSIKELCSIADRISEHCGIEIRTVSGGNSSVIPILKKGIMPKKVNQLRFGEAILLGRVPPSGKPVEGIHKDSFSICAEVVEVARKGRSGEERERAVLALGKQDVLIEGLHSSNGSCILGASSDNIIIDTGRHLLKIGDLVSFTPNYDCLVRAMISPFIYKEYLN